MIDLNHDTVMIYAVKSYDKPTYIKSELHDDLKHLSYVRRLFRRYRQYGELRENLIINHLVIVHNIFGMAATRLLFYHVREEDHAILKTFLLFLNYMPSKIEGIRGRTILSDDLQVDPLVVDVLRGIRAHERDSGIIEETQSGV
jgi:hypothetical protein